MKKLTQILLAVGAVIAAVHLYAKAVANKLKNGPNPYTFEQLATEPEGTTHFISCEDGTILRAVSYGAAAQTVVFAHGYGASLLEWNLIWAKLAQMGGYRLIAFDQRGHEKSATVGHQGIGSQQMASDYKAVLEYFDVRNGILVGHSMGCFLTIVFLLTYPEVARARLKGAVLVSGLAGKATEGSPQNKLEIPLIQLGLISAIARSDPYGWLFGASIYGDDPSPAGIQTFTELIARQNHLVLVPIIRALADEDYYGRLGEIDLPCVIVCGDKDATTPKWHAEKMAETIPNVREIWIPGRGHMLNWEAPEIIIEAIKSLQ